MAAAGAQERPTAGDGAGDLTIGDLAAATGVAQATLRSWEDRYDFPRPQRRPSGHRRYGEQDVELVRRVARARDSGVSLTKAIADVRAYAAPESVYAELRRAHPDLPVMRVRKRTLLALTRALEDECCARAQRPLLVGTFQHERFLRQARRRWRELARTARRTVVFAELDAGAPAPAGVEVVPLPPDSVLGREWTVLCLAEDMAAVLTAFELPGQDAGDDADRRFEAVWSLERSVVQDAAAVALAIAGSDPAEAAAVGLTADAARSEELARAGATLARAMGYLDDSR